ncbi:MAG TPA: DUF2332 domain-containing protein [Candidatus Acidoferrales bacterium]|nr:DUF2332 domain-containing protein [Candidatus Acidoferrales bacterium]
MSDAASDSVDETLHAQAVVCAAYGSPFYGVLLDEAAKDYRSRGPVRAFFKADPRRRHASRIGIRLAGALQLRALDGSAPQLAAHFPSTGGDGDAAAAWREARKLLNDDAARFGEPFDRTPQTNEVARSMPLLGGLLAIVDATRLPVALLDVGSSAGLNLRLDRYRYEGDGWSWGDARSPLVLRNEIVSGRPAHLDVRPDVVARTGCDLHPLDVMRESDCLALRSFVWPDQFERFARLDAAIAVARRVPARIERADFLQWIPQRALPRKNTVTVVMHSVVTEHLEESVHDAMRAAIETACRAATAAAPMAWLRLEPVAGMRYETRVTLWPSREERVIAHCNGHAQAIEWARS